ncbi:MAG: hypothetical protein IPH51_19225 [Rubrivivax sp.]|nr:hypothetical protein [Rubrivivax sp.]
MSAVLAWQVDAFGKALQPEQDRSLFAVDRGTMPGQHLHLRHRALHQGAAPQVLRQQRIDLAHLLARREQHQRTERLNETGHPLDNLVRVPPRIARIRAHRRNDEPGVRSVVEWRFHAQELDASVGRQAGLTEEEVEGAAGSQRRRHQDHAAGPVPEQLAQLVAATDR